MKIATRMHAALVVGDATFKNPRRRGRGGRPVSVDEPETRELALHIGRHGLRYPLRITPSGAILAGQRRWLAIGMVIRWREALRDDVEPDETHLFDDAAFALAAAVPCIVREGEDPADMTADAVGDNLQRKEMSTYDVAETIMELLEPPAGREGKSQAWIAREIGRSPSYVSRLVATWKNAIPALHDAWASEALPYETIRSLADLSEPDQVLALAGAEPKPRGAHGRPGIDAVKDALTHLHAHRAELPPAPPAEVAREILAWVTGAPASPRVAALLGLA